MTAPMSLPCDADKLTELIPVLRGTAFALTGSRDRAEDLAQDALLRVWARLSAGEEIAELRPYLYATLRNLARRPPRLAPAEAAPEDTSPDAASDRIACREVLAALAALPPDQARLLARAALGRESLADIAADCGLPAGTVASRLSRARAQLRQRLDLPDAAPVSALLGR